MDVYSQNKQLKDQVDALEAQSDKALASLPDSHPEKKRLSDWRASIYALFITQVEAMWLMYEDALEAKDQSAQGIYSSSFRKAAELQIQEEEKFLADSVFAESKRKRQLIIGVAGAAALASILLLAKRK